MVSQSSTDVKKREAILKILPEYRTAVCYWGSGTGTKIRNVGRRPASLRRLLGNKIDDSNIADVSAGNRVSCIITDAGKCFSWGDTFLGRPSNSATDKVYPAEIPINNGDAIKSVVYGDSHACLMTYSGFIYEFGSVPSDNTSTKIHRIKVPIRQSHVRSVEQVVCGQSSTLLLFSNGSVSMKGGNRRRTFQAIGKRNLSVGPDLIVFPESIRSIASGMNHCLAVSNTGTCYAWGLAERLGLGPDVDGFISKPKRIEYFNQLGVRVAMIACGSTHSCVVSHDGRQVFSFGDNSHCQCGPQTYENVLIPTEVKLEDLVVFKIACGFAHSAVITNTGKLLTWGFNDDGQLGLGHEYNIGLPTYVSFEETDINLNCVVSVACGYTHTLCVLSDYPPDVFWERQTVVTSMIKSAGVMIRFFKSLRTKMKSVLHHNVEKVAVVDDASLDGSGFKLIADEVSPITSKYMEGAEDDDLLDFESKTTYVSENHEDQRYKNLLERVDMSREDELSRQAEKERHRLGIVRKGLALEALRIQSEIGFMYREDILSHSMRERKNKVYDNRCKSTTMIKVKTRNKLVDEQIKKSANRLLQFRSKIENERARKLKPKKTYVPGKENIILEKNMGTVKEKGPTSKKSECVPPRKNPQVNKRILYRRAVRLKRQMEIESHLSLQLSELATLLKHKKNIEELTAARVFAEKRRLQQCLVEGTVKKSVIELIKLKDVLGLLDSNENSIEDDVVSTSHPRFRSIAEWSRDLMN